MKITPLETSIARIFFAPDTDAATGGAAPAPMGAAIESVSHTSSASAPKEVDLSPSPKPKPISAIEKLGLDKGRIQGPKDALGSSATPKATIKAEVKRLQNKFTPKHIVPRADIAPPSKPVVKATERQRGEDGKFLPVEGEPKAVIAAPKIEPPKIKIGNQEKTAEEWESEFKALKEPPKPSEAKPAEQKKDEPADKEREATELKSQRESFIKEEMKRYTIDGAAMDKALASNDSTAVPSLIAETFAKLAADLREWTVANVQPHLDRIGNDLRPFTEQQKQIREYESERDFLGQNADIKANPKGIEEARKVRGELSGYYDTIQQKIAQGTATVQEQEHARLFEQATPEKFNADVAFYVRQRLGIKEGAPPTPTPAPVATPTPVVVTAAPQPKPPGGQAPGGTGAPIQLSEQQKHIARMRSAGV